ncbi:MAG TPA: NgoMIV family type II restriction endonuclease [Phycisphaerae bacterium]|nr:NgoMIV family type II restriction endonuclease [Phycisphaerae bacterium]
MTQIEKLRRAYHRRLCTQLLSYRLAKGKCRTDVPNIADRDSRTSVEFSQGLVAELGHKVGNKDPSAGTLGKQFAELTKGFLETAFPTLGHLRPGRWFLSTSQAGTGIAAFDQYEHIARLAGVLEKNRDLRAALGGDYLIRPDIIVARDPEPDERINAHTLLVENGRKLVTHSPLREGNVPGSPAILHASISCKWTMRSDRSQNTRTEALNLIRNRKGNTPHIVAVTFEPLPGRLASIALGTGDLDCTYHVALHELVKVVDRSKKDTQIEQLRDLVQGRRLRDISDLPFDLAV